MMRRFHELRRHEEGQALVLAAISMLILTLCVLATVNITYAAAEKIKLQNAADAAAYTTAAYQARALNYFAYTNRAMTVQYASQMNMLAMFSYMMFAAAVWEIFSTITSSIPVLGWIILILSFIIMAVALLVDIALTITIPLVDGFTWGMATAQKAAQTGMLSRVAAGPHSEVASYNPEYQVTNIATPISGGLDAATRWSRAVDSSAIPDLSPIDSRDRLIMTEIANSARSDWTVGTKTGFTLLAIPRNLNFSASFLGVLRLDMGKYARTSWGSMAPGSGGGGGFLGGLLGSMSDVTERFYSLDRFNFSITVWRFTLYFRIDAVAAADRRFGGHSLGSDMGFDEPSCGTFNLACKATRALLGAIIKPIAQVVLQAVDNAMSKTKAVFNHPLSTHHFHLGQFPFAKFRPGNAVDGNNPRGQDLFNQPPTVVMVTAPQSYLLSRGRPFLSSFNVKIGAIGSGGSGSMLRGVPASRRKMGYRDGVTFDPGDRPLAILNQPGFHAMSAAVAYYHRPGDWREPPNLFNPMWGAKLMPVTDYPMLQGNPALERLAQPALNLMVH